MTNEELNLKVAELRHEDNCCGGCRLGNCGPMIFQGSILCNFEPKDYATDMNCAMELVEEMGVLIDALYPYTNEVVSQATGWPVVTTDSTLPRAICMAYIEYKESARDKA